MANKLLRMVVMGAPASGKGTVSARIVDNFGLQHVSSGDKLRQHVKEQTVIGKQAKKYMDEGGLVPDDVMLKLLTGELMKVKNQSWLLDGFPRTLPQAEKLWKFQKLDLVINLVVPFNVIINRTKNRWVHLPSGRVYNVDFNAPKVPGKDDVTGENLVQREDDKPEVVLKRLEGYEELSRPLVSFYARHGVLESFHGNTTDEIWPKVFDCLCSHMQPRQKESSN